MQDFQLSGSTLFPGFVEITRNDAPGQTFICFNQFRSHFFKYLARGTLSGWVHKLNIQKWKCRDKEQQIFKSIVPEEKGKSLYLIKREHALQLLRHHRERHRDLDARACLYNRNSMASGLLATPPSLVSGAVPFAATTARDVHLLADPRSTAAAVGIAVPSTMPQNEQRRSSGADDRCKAEDQQYGRACVYNRSSMAVGLAVTPPALVSNAVQLATTPVQRPDVPLPDSPQPFLPLADPSTTAAVGIAVPSTTPRDEQRRNSWADDRYQSLDEDEGDDYQQTDPDASCESGSLNHGSGGNLRSLSEKDMTLTLKKPIRRP